MISGRTTATVVLLVLATFLSGIIHGRFTHRWGVPVDLAAAGNELARFPKEFGDWQMVDDRPLTETVRETLQCSGYLSRTYAHRTTGELVNMVLLVGPAGPTSVHTPDICYSSQDYAQEGPREATQVQATDKGQTGSFWVLKLRPNSLEARRLTSYYAWSDGGRWEATENPRWTFGGKPMLYKLQLAAPAPPVAEPSKPDPGKLFLQSFLAKGVWPLPSRDDLARARNGKQQELTAMTKANFRTRVFELDETFRGITPSKYLSGKRYISPLLAMLLLLPAACVIAVLAATIRLTSRGPAFFCQERVGKDGRTFTMYKLRTMYEGAEETTGPVWSQRHDPRTTPIGRVMRRLHLDELPQLINVIRGEMSLVGPRPERPEFVEMLADEVPCYLDRLSVLPGISGLAQIHLPPDENLDCVRRKLILDLQYIETATLPMDLRVVLCSFLRMIGVPGHIAARVVGFRYPYALLQPLGPAQNHHDRSGVAGNGHAKPVSLSELKAVLSGGAHRVAVASPHLFTFEDEVPAPETLERKLR